METAANPTTSPTSSILQVLTTMFVACALALLFGARGLVHAGHGMEDGPARSLTLTVGQALLAIDEPLHLTAPWDTLEAALGRSDQGTSPLLASAPKTVTGSSRNAAGDPIIRRAPRPKRNTRAAIHGPARLMPARRLPPTRVPTARNPLRLLATGDSLTEFMGPDLVDAAAQAGPVQGSVDTHYGTGLARPDFVDWSVLAHQQMVHDNPEAIVVLMGGNDNQNLTLLGGQILYRGTEAWTREYARRAEVCMRIWLQGGRRRLYWLSVPPARDPAWTTHNREINQALKMAAARVPGARFLNVLGPVTSHGRYADFVPVNGQMTLVREPDGIHFNSTGSAIIANEVLRVLAREWHFGKV